MSIMFNEIYLYIYIYIERERKRERGSKHVTYAYVLAMQRVHCVTLETIHENININVQWTRSLTS